jgi:type II secretory pathway pseudopilin PulG
MSVFSRGFALIDVLAATATLVVLSALAVPVVSGLHDRAQVRAAARYLSGRLHAARLEALRRNAVVSLRFDDASSGYAFRLYVDGDGDGVLQRDIDAGVDMPLGDTDRLDHHFGDITFRVNADVPGVDGAGTIAAASDPLHIGRTRFVSFNPLGGCTGGTLFLAATRGPQAAVRLLGQTGRVRALWFDGGSRQWREG